MRRFNKSALPLGLVTTREPGYPVYNVFPSSACLTIPPEILQKHSKRSSEILAQYLFATTYAATTAIHDHV